MISLNISFQAFCTYLVRMLIEPLRPLKVEVFDTTEKVPQAYYNDDNNVILAIDTYNQKIINLKDVK